MCSFLVSIFFNNANLAACVGCLLYFLVFFAHISLLPNQNTLPPALVVLACLWAPLAYGLGASYIVQYELEQQGLQWGNIALTPVRILYLLGGGGGGGGVNFIYNSKLLCCV